MKNVITLFTTILLVLIFLSCNNKEGGKQKKEKEQIVTGVPEYTKLVNNEKERTRLWKAAIDSGDFRAYNKIAVAYFMSYRSIDLYYYSLIMANKYHCPEAYYNLHMVLTTQTSTGDMVLLSKDKDTKSLALYYLFKASELGSIKAKDDIELEFGKGKSLANSSFFLKQLMHP
ncbi:MAG TPA: hypothetical protein VNW95_01140 [Mucilaginibacter sp.]|nr:hypothetical protein [Mucilaginibacter sp.]